MADLIKLPILYVHYAFFFLILRGMWLQYSRSIWWCWHYKHFNTKRHIIYFSVIMFLIKHVLTVNEKSVCACGNDDLFTTTCCGGSWRATVISFSEFMNHDWHWRGGVCVRVALWLDVGCLPVFSGMEAWSLFLSFLKIMLPNCSTAETTFNMPGKDRITLYKSSGGEIR